MGEIVQIQVGRCGNRVGNKFWKTISDEHGLDEQGRFVGSSADVQLDRINVYYEETSRQVYAPRAVLVSLDATAARAAADLADGRASPPAYVTGRGCGTAGLWPRGYYAADDVPGRARDAVRAAAERCDRLQGFQVVHSLAGGTGSGLGARVADDLGPAYPGRAVVAYAVAPWPSASASAAAAVEPYNATACAARLTDAAHCTYVLDNRSLRRDAAGLCGGGRPLAYSDLNRAAARAMSGVTATLRFAGAARPDAGLRKSVTELVPYPAMRFLVPGFASLSSPPPPWWCAPAPGGLAARLLAAVAASPDGRAVVTAAAITYRHAPGRDGAETAGTRPPGDALRPEDYRRIRPRRFRWSPDTVKTARCDVPARGHRAGAAVAANTTAVCGVLERACRGADSAAVSRAFADHGVTADEFRLARERVRTLVDHYREVQRAGSGYDECGDEGDDYDCDDYGCDDADGSDDVDDRATDREEQGEQRS